jgi:F0F1-type ATP synthase assembly protein I
MFSEISRLAILQSLIAVAALAAGGMWGGWLVGLSAGWGAATALLATAVLVWRQRRGRQNPQWRAGRQLGNAYRAAFERWLLVAVLLGIGLGWANLAPGPLLVGFVLTQLGWLFAGCVKK